MSDKTKLPEDVAVALSFAISAGVDYGESKLDGHFQTMREGRANAESAVLAAIAAARAEGEKAGRAAGREEMREWCAQFVEDVEGDEGPVKLANRIRALVLP